MFTELSASSRKMAADIETLKMRVSQHDEQFRCTSLHPEDSHILTEYHRRNHSSTMMCLEELERDGASRRADYSMHGSCLRAAAEAKVFFEHTHKLLDPKIIKGVLFAPAGGLTLRGNQATPTSDRGAVVYGQAYTLRNVDGCVWVKRTDLQAPDPSLNHVGHFHYVTMVRVSDGDEVAVDWSLGQFETIPDHLTLFLYKDSP
jgi:hypothetical protein